MPLALGPGATLARCRDMHMASTEARQRARLGCPAFAPGRPRPALDRGAAAAARGRADGRRGRAATRRDPRQWCHLES